ncbi:hypothetical protein [Micromonospora rubida]
MSYDDALCEAADLGLRPATPDEWEYACGAGATTLFRWGDGSRGLWLNSEDGYVDRLLLRPVIDLT